MNDLVYRSIVALCVCWNSVNGSPPVSSQHTVSPFAAGPSGRHDGSEFSNLSNIQPSVSRTNALTRPGRTGYGGMVLHNEIGKKADFTTLRTKLDAKKSTAEFDESNKNNMMFVIGGASMDIVRFYEDVYNTLKRHLFDCLQIDNTGTNYTLPQVVDFISIKQNLLNNSIALLLQSELDISRLMRLYLFFCSPIQVPDSSEKGVKYREYSRRIFYLQKDMKYKFKDVVGSKLFSDKLHINQSQKLKENTERKLLGLATSAIYKYKPKGPLLPGTPLHFVCIDILKWTALMETDNKDAVEIQRMKITVENAEITMRQYAERYRYEIDVGNLDRLNYEVLLRINNILLRYLYKHFALSTSLINTNISKLKSNNMVAISLVIAQTEGLRAFLEILDQFFVTRYLYYVVQTTAKTKLTALISYMDRFSANVEDTVRELELSPEKTVNDIDKLINEFATALLLDLKVDDPQKWIDGVNEEVVGMSDNISAAIELNKQNALAIIAVCVKQLNPDWPNIRYRDPIEFLTATKLAHQILHTEECDYKDDNIYLN